MELLGLSWLEIKTVVNGKNAQVQSERRRRNEQLNLSTVQN
jgi:hypothetical protein